MSKSFNNPLELDLKSSVSLTTILMLSHLGAIVCLVTIPVATSVKIPLMLIVLLSAVYSIRRYAMLSADRSIRKITLRFDDCRFVRRTGEAEDALLVPDQTVNTGSLVVLKLMTDGKSCVVPVFKDMLENDTYRRLRVYLQTRIH